MRNYFAQKNLRRSDLLRNKDFLQDAAEFMKARTGRQYEKDEKLFDAFVEHMRIANVNEITAVRDLNYIKKADQAGKDQAGRLYLTFDRLTKPTSALKTIADYGEGLLRAPSTYISLTGVGILGKGAATATTKGLQQTARLLATKTLGQQTRKAATRGAGIEGAIGGIQGAAYTAARKETGREEFEDRNVLGGALLGGAFGAVPGAVFGGATGFKVAKQEAKAMADLQEGAKKRALRINDATKITETKKSEDKAYAEMHETLDFSLPKIARADLPEEDIAAGKQLRVLTEEYSATMNPEVRNNLKGAITELLQELGVTKTGTGDTISMLNNKGEVKRITQIISEALQRQADVEKIPTKDLDISVMTNIQTKYGLTSEQFAYMFTSEISDAGRTLAFASAMSRGAGAMSPDKLYKQLIKETTMMENYSKAMGKEELIVDKELSLALKRYSPTNSQKLVQFIGNLDKARLGLMTVQAATTMRNTIGGGLRAALFVLDNLFQGGLELVTAGSSELARKQAISRMVSGARLWKSLTWNQAEANALRLLFHEEMPTTFRRLYRQNADVAASIGMGLSSRLATFARKANFLNTYSDNAFKRAVFMAELQTQLGGRNELSTIIRSGRFAELGEKKYTGAIENSIKEATRLVYQRTFREQRYERKLAEDQKGRKFLPKRRTTELEPIDRRGFSAAPDRILRIMSTPLTTWAIPFPKFVMNSLEFMYTHAPIIGLTSLSKEAVAKNMTGTALLYGAIQLRAAQGPEARWWEFYDKETKEHKNAVALYGPFAPYMLAADLILRSNMNNENGKYVIKPVPLISGSEEYKKATAENWARVIKDPLTVNMFNDNVHREYLKAVFGTTFRTGIGLDFIKELETEIENSLLQETEEGTAVSSAAGKAVAKFGGMWANTFLVGGGMIRDLYSAIDPQYEKIRDTNVFTNAGDIFIANAFKSLPISDEGKYLGIFKGPEGIELVATSPTQQNELRREGRDLTQFTGLGSQVVLPAIENELIRLGIPRYKAYKSYRRQPDLNRRANALYQEYTEKIIVPYIEGTEYNSFDNTPSGARQQKKRLQDLFSQMRIEVADILLDQTSTKYNRLSDSPEQAEKIHNEIIFLVRLQFDRLGKDSKALAREAFKAAEKRPARTEGPGAIADLLKLIEYGRGY
tara:strand:- start:162 stop:3632 length:3471 start_codon:yes stop_codon:yes gene_type:complete